ncbi:hypothetical protein [Streptomyces sp. NEAU-YJ-81]|uniref:hypothetical protein n=1 Tax=Streptomyces sp. NEAU-YJ-81 TaxID=2820288 RepID=UPI001ABCEDE7|nr:hypothetical protein [Streptomyces sp. NEAU-YJ-81]MBO3682580.1 hypothetical protein [Streptomyces sp. NEAU-YJ-81]
MARPLARAGSASRCERARLAAGVLTARVHAVRRSRRLGSHSLPHTVTAPAGPPSRPRRDRGEAGVGRAVRKASGQEQATDVATAEETRRVNGAAAKMAAKIQGGIRERTVAHEPRPRPAPAHRMTKARSSPVSSG